MRATPMLTSGTLAINDGAASRLPVPADRVHCAGGGTADREAMMDVSNRVSGTGTPHFTPAAGAGSGGGIGLLPAKRGRPRRRPPAGARGDGHGIGGRAFRCAVVTALAAALLLAAGGADAGDLLVGTAPGRDGSPLTFRLEAENRRDVVGGRIVLGEIEYEVSRISRLGLIGARRFAGGDPGQERYAEFLVFSSSFGEQTAVGKPWLAAREAYGCEDPYNTYLAFYRVEGEAAVKSLGPVPYPALAEDPSLSQRSRVLCFMARPPG